MDDSDADQRQPHKLEPNQPVSGKQLEELGVLHWVLDADNYETDPELQKIRKDRNYSYQVRQTLLPTFRWCAPSFEDANKCETDPALQQIRKDTELWLW